MFEPRQGRFYCVRCLAGPGKEGWGSLEETLEHLLESHGLRRGLERPDRDWVTGERALDILAERPQRLEERVARFSLYLAGCFGVDDVIAATPRRPELGH